jgi:hypothetical protein
VGTSVQKCQQLLRVLLHEPFRIVTTRNRAATAEAPLTVKLFASLITSTSASDCS